MSGSSAGATPHHAWVMHVFLTLVIGIAFVGFFVGLRQGKMPRVAAPVFEDLATVDPAAVPSTTWADFDRRRFGPNREWTSSLASLNQPESDLFATVNWSPEQRAALLTERASRRAFDGAPPVVPHPTDQLSSTSCVACHAHGLVIPGDMRAPQMSHQLFANCTQCHVEQNSARFDSFLFDESSFAGLIAPVLGSRAWTGAPPTIPHPTMMRDNCQACHGPNGPQAIRSTHPWRTNCLQCHAPSATLDQAGSRGAAEFLSAPAVRTP